MTSPLVKTKLLLFFLFTLPSLSQLHAQDRCGFDGIMHRFRKENPGFEEELNKKVKEYILKRRSTSARMSGLPGTLYHIPVVVHVIHTGGAVGTTYNPTNATIKGAIDYLNAVYNGTWTGAGGPILGAGDIQIQFVLATKDTAGNPSTGINRVDGSVLSGYATTGINLSSGTPNEVPVKDLSRWDPATYYNIWVVNKIDGQDGTTPGIPFTAGYAYFPMPNNTSAANLNRDGIVMLATQMRAGAKTLPHEIGHAFNLYHPFEGETSVSGPNGCPPNTSPSTEGDRCADTDPVINPADDSYGATAFSCRTGTNSCSGLAYTDNTEKNFMNYTNCYQLFTNDQKARMQAAVATTTREGLADSWANNEGAYPTTWTPPVAPAVTPASSGGYANYLGIMYVSLNGKKIYSLNTTQDGGYVNNTKWYNLFALQPNTTYSVEIGLKNSGNDEQVGIWIDYNGDGAFNDAEEREYYSDGYSHNMSNTINQLTFSFTTPSTLSGNTVRMRVMNDFSTLYGFAGLTGASTTTAGGQAEDYPVFLMNTTPTPVTLVDFSGQTASGRTYLTWKTSQEFNAKEYQVQRSPNGNDFTTIGSVTARSNTSTETTYQYTDHVASSGSYFYRLKMVDIDESFTYSKILRFNMEAPSGVQVIGNPFANNIKLVLPGHKGAATLRLLDAAGKVLISRTLPPAQPNAIELSVDQQLSRGLYILEVFINNERLIHKLLKE